MNWRCTRDSCLTDLRVSTCLWSSVRHFCDGSGRTVDTVFVGQKIYIQDKFTENFVFVPRKFSSNIVLQFDILTSPISSLVNI